MSKTSRAIFRVDGDAVGGWPVFLWWSPVGDGQ